MAGLIAAWVVCRTPDGLIGVFTREAYKAHQRSLRFVSSHRTKEAALRAAAVTPRHEVTE